MPSDNSNAESDGLPEAPRGSAVKALQERRDSERVITDWEQETRRLGRARKRRRWITLHFSDRFHTGSAFRHPTRLSKLYVFRRRTGDPRGLSREASHRSVQGDGRLARPG